MEHKIESRLPVTKNLFSMRVAGASLALLALATVWCSVRGRSDGAREVVHAREDGDGQVDAEELSITKAEQYGVNTASARTRLTQLEQVRNGYRYSKPK